MNDIAHNLPEGILIKTKDGRFRLVKGGTLVDYTPVASEGEPMDKPQPIKPALSRPSPPTYTKPTAAYYVHPDDEEEIRRHEEKIKTLVEEVPFHEIDPIIERIMARHHLTFGDEILRKRFFSIASSRLTDIRDSIETEEALKKSSKVGGMSYDEVLAKNLLLDLEQEAAKIHDQVTIRKIRQAEAKKAEAREAKVTEPETLVKPMMPPPRPTPLPKPFVSPAPPVRPKPIPPEPTVVSPPTIPKITRPEIIEEKPKVIDIKKPAKLVGPIEELGMLSLEDFRKLGKTTQESLKKLLEKFDLLEEESITTKAEGINAWHSSLVHTQYLEIGRESIEQRKTVHEVIAERMSEGKATLTEEEFLAVADLNKKLRF